MEGLPIKNTGSSHLKLYDGPRGTAVTDEFMLYGTNINHKGLQWTANEYAEERRICKDLISKNKNVDVNFCKQNTAMLTVLREF